MYFCPCSCSKPDCETEEDVLICLPRNLSYAGESYLDRYSISSAFVHNGKLEKQLLKSDAEEQYLKAGAAACAELRKLEEAGISEGEEVGEGGGEREGVKRGGGGEEGEEEEEEGGDSEHLLGACSAMAARPLTYREENSRFRRGGPDNCDVVTMDPGPTPSSLTAMSLSRSPPPTPDPDEPPSPSSSPPLRDLPPPPPAAASSSSSPPQLTVTIPRDTSCSSSDDAEVRAATTTTTTTTKTATPQSALFDRYVVQQETATESPDSDLVSEEGIFVNLMDDLDGLSGGPLGGKSTLSEASDDTYVSGDSMYYSPEEVDDMEDDQVRGQDLKVSLEEAVQQVAAFVFQATDPGSSSPPLPPPASEEHLDAASPDVVVDGSSISNGSSAVVSLPRPHANDGESEDSATQGRDCETAKNGDLLPPPGYSACPVLQMDTTNSDTTTTIKCELANDGQADSNKPADAVPQSPAKNPGSLGIKLTVDGGREGKGAQLGSSYHDLLSPNSPLYDDREFNFHRVELRKSTSLKSTKTPPGTPRRKKVVRFADAMGLDLESVRHVLNMESPPKIPPSAMKDLQPGLSEDRKGMGSKFITETFPQPGVDLRFRDRVLKEKVVLENALVVSGSITGVVRVANISFHKAVRVRFTTNGWASFHDIAASYMVNSNDGSTDRFSFTLVPPPDFCPGARLEFAVSYSANGTDYWDNNYGNNYVFECYAKTVPTETENAWMHFL